MSAPFQSSRRRCSSKPDQRRRGCNLRTIIPEKARFDLAQLPQQDIGKMVGRFRKRIERSAVSHIPMFGSIDVSINVEANGTAMAQAHLHLVCLTPNTATFRGQVKSAFKPEKAALRPFVFKQVKALAGLATYVFKTQFYRRSQYAATSGARVAKQRLKLADNLAIVQWLGNSPVGCRTFLRGIRRDGKSFRRLPTSQRKNVVG